MLFSQFDRAVAQGALRRPFQRAAVSNIMHELVITQAYTTKITV